MQLRGHRVNRHVYDIRIFHHLERCASIVVIQSLGSLDSSNREEDPTW